MQIGVDTARAVENKRIFVVDSDEIMRAALQFMLHDENETHELATLADAFAKGDDWRPDLVLLGLDIVAAEGVAVLGRIGERYPGVRILLVAADKQDPLVRAGLGTGAHGVIAKPLTIEAVRAKTDIQLGRRKPMLVPLLSLL